MDNLATAELQFRLACGVRVSCATDSMKLAFPEIWTYGRHMVTEQEMRLSPDELELASAALQHSATYLLAMQIYNSFGERAPVDAVPDVRSAYEIARLIRHAFAHGPFFPIWQIAPERCRDRVFEVPEVICLNTSGLDSQPMRLRDLGGPLALLRLGQFVRQYAAGDQSANSPAPDDWARPSTGEGQQRF